MVCKNALLSCASAVALSFAMTQSVLAVPVEEVSATEVSVAEAPAAESPAAEEATAGDAPAAESPAAEEAAAEEAPAEEAPAAEAPAAEVVVEEVTVEAAPVEAPVMPSPPQPPMSMMAPPPVEPPELPPEVQERLEKHRQKMAMSPEERWEARRAELNQRYEELRARAAEAGVPLPETAPWDREPGWPSHDQMGQQMPEQPAWPGSMGMSDEELQAHREAMQQRLAEMRKMREQMAAMTPEERESFREQQYQEMREQAAARGIELPEAPPWKQAPAVAPEPPAMPAEPDWAKYEDVIAGMSPEEREACMAMHRMHMRNMTPPLKPMMPPRGYGYGPDQGFGPGEGYGPGQGYGQGPGWGRGAGYGPRWGGWQGYQE